MILIPVQYGRWAGNMLRGRLGLQPNIQRPGVGAAAGSGRLPHWRSRCMPCSCSSLLASISGLRAGWRPMRFWDWLFRGLAYIGGAIPAFHSGPLPAFDFLCRVWAGSAPGRLSVRTRLGSADDFIRYTGLLTLDGLLNGRADVAKDALNHLVSAGRRPVCLLLGHAGAGHPGQHDG